MLDSLFLRWVEIPAQLFSFIILLIYWGIIRLSKKDLAYYMIFLLIPSTIVAQFSIAIAMICYVVGLSAIIIKKSTHWMNVFHLLVSIIIGILMDHLATIIMVKIWPSLLFESTGFALSRLLIFFLLVAICAFLYKNIVGMIRRTTIFKNEFLGLTLVILTALTLIVMYINIFAVRRKGQTFLMIQNNLWLFTIFFIVFIGLVIFMLYLTIKRMKITQTEKEMENFKVYVSSIETINNDMRKFKHDYLNILTSMRTFIDMKDYQGLEAYFYNHILQTEKQEFEQTAAFLTLNKLQHNSLKGILTTKILMAQSLNIPFTVEVTDKIEAINMDIIQLNRVIGILVDNAIEASTTVQSPQIRLAFIKFDDRVVMVLTNKFDCTNDLKVHEIFKDGFSTKSENRGVGLGTLRDIVRANPNLNLSTKIDYDIFVQQFEVKGD